MAVHNCKFNTGSEGNELMPDDLVQLTSVWGTDVKETPKSQTLNITL